MHERNIEASDERLALLAARMLEAPVGLVSLLDAETETLRGAFGLSEPLNTVRSLPAPAGLCSRIMARDGVTRVNDVRRATGFGDLSPDLRFAALLGAPLEVDGVRVGALLVLDHRPRRWSDRHVESLRELAAEVSAVLALRRHAGPGPLLSSEDELREHRRQMALLRSVAIAANASTPVDDALREALRTILDATGWSVAHVYLAHGDQMAPSDVWVGADLPGFKPLIAVSMEPVTRETARADGGSLIADVVKSRKIRVIERLDEEPSFRAYAALKDAGLHSALFLPILVGTDVAAVATLFFAPPARPPSLGMLDVLESIGTILGRAFERDHARRELEAHAAEVRELSLVDELTGLYNRRGFLTLAEQQVRIGHRTGTRHHLIFADLDGMKAINDRFGHAQGDLALQDTARVLRQVFRESDIVARLGGDEFVAFAADSSKEGASRILDRLRSALTAFNDARERPFAIEMSLGATLYDPARPNTLDELLAHADQLMYEEKRLRRNRAAS